jgi:hypothetical protein
MSLFRPAATLAAAATLLLAACGDDSGTNSGNTSTMSATVAGTAWSGSLAVQGQYGANLLSITGTNGTYQIALNVPGVASTGTFNFGPGNLTVAQLVQVTTGTPTWTSSLVGGTGSITVTTLTASRAAGTFSFTGAASPGTSATGTRAVTNGSFDVRF